MMLVLFSVTTYINFRESQKVAENANYLATSSNLIRLGGRFQKNILNMERGLRGYLITNEKYFLKGYDSSKLENTNLISQIHPILKNDTAQFVRFTKIIGLYNKWINEYAERIRKIKVKDSIAGIEDEYLRNNSVIAEEVGVNKDLQKKFNELIKVEYDKQIKNKDILIQSEQHTKTVSLILTIFTIIIVIVIAIFLERQISMRLKKMIKMTNSIGEGDFKVYVRDSEHDELSELTQSLNKMSQMLDQQVSLLERKNQELDQFANVVSHDLKAPLRGIENVISWIEEDHKADLPEKVKEYIGLIKGRILKAEKLIEGILKYARVGKEVHKKEKIDVNTMLLDIIDSLPKHKNIRIEIQPDMPIFISEKIPLSQIFTNLIGNAIKYNDQQKGIIKIYFLEQNNTFRFFIEDNGPGIDKSHHDRIFIIFQTLSTYDSYENTGIGLAIVKKILDERKEQIKIESEPGKGAIFSFTWGKF